MSGKTHIAWQPQKGPQKALIDCPVYEIFYGGARGGGKTDGALGKLGLKACRYGNAFNAVHFRREMPQSDDVIERSKEIYGPIGGRYQEQQRQWRFPGGGRLRFRPLENIRDAEKYQGQNLSDAVVEEAGNYPDPSPIQRLHGCLRSTRGTPVQLLLTGNPGGPGQHWIKSRYIDPAPQGMEIIRETIEFRGMKTVRSRVFIPAKVLDNKMLSDPMGYVASLQMVGSEQLVKAWLDGDWDAIVGAYFDCWGKERHVIRPFPLQPHWLRFRSMDWGSAKPFSVGWWTALTESVEHPDGSLLPKGALVRYREWYGCKEGQPNVGLKMTAEQVANGIKERETSDPRTDRKEPVHYSVADPSIFARDGGPSIAERMAKEGVGFRPADNKRVGDKGHMGGWDQMRQRLIGEDGRPMIYCFSTCTDSIRTIPALQHDEHRPEDVDTDGEDHAGDCWRYACMSRPWLRQAPPLNEPIIGLEGLTLDRLHRAAAENRKRRR